MISIDIRPFRYHKNISHQWKKKEIYLSKIYDVPLKKNKNFVSSKCFNMKRIGAYICKMM